MKILFHIKDVENLMITKIIPAKTVIQIKNGIYIFAIELHPIYLLSAIDNHQRLTIFQSFLPSYLIKFNTSATCEWQLWLNENNFIII